MPCLSARDVNIGYQGGVDYYTAAVVYCYYDVDVAVSLLVMRGDVSIRCSRRHPLRSRFINTMHPLCFVFFRLPTIVSSRQPFLLVAELNLPSSNVVPGYWLYKGVVGMSNGVVFESLSGIVLSDEDSDRSVSDIDESVIASEYTSFARTRASFIIFTAIAVLFASQV